MRFHVLQKALKPDIAVYYSIIGSGGSAPELFLPKAHSHIFVIFHVTIILTSCIYFEIETKFQRLNHIFGTKFTTVYVSMSLCVSLSSSPY